MNSFSFEKIHTPCIYMYFSAMPITLQKSFLSVKSMSIIKSCESVTGRSLFYVDTKRGTVGRVSVVWWIYSELGNQGYIAGAIRGLCHQTGIVIASYRAESSQ